MIGDPIGLVTGLISGPGHIGADPPDETVAATSSTPSSCRPTLAGLPAEVLELIVFYIEEYQDLVSLSASCKPLHAILFDGFVRCFHLRAGLNRPTLWQYLSEHPRDARKIRSLTIDGRPKPKLPFEIDKHPSRPFCFLDYGKILQLEEVFIAALGRMSSLRQFIFRLDPPLSGNNFWTQLWESCPDLINLECAEPCNYQNTAESSLINGSSFFKCRGLRRFVYYSGFQPRRRSDKRTLRKLHENLRRNCPQLQELEPWSLCYTRNPRQLVAAPSAPRASSAVLTAAANARRPPSILRATQR